jgi:hypothetical protein
VAEADAPVPLTLVEADGDVGDGLALGEDADALGELLTEPPTEVLGELATDPPTDVLGDDATEPPTDVLGDVPGVALAEPPTDVPGVALTEPPTEVLGDVLAPGALRAIAPPPLLGDAPPVDAAAWAAACWLQASKSACV